MPQYGEVIAKYRKLNGLTQSDLAEKLSISSQAVSKWENNQSEPDIETINKITNILGITLDEFFKKGETIAVKNNLNMCYACGNYKEKNDIHHYKPEIVCNECHTKLEREDEVIKNLLEQSMEKNYKRKRRTYKPFIVGSIIGLIVLAFFISSYFMGETTDLTKGQYFGTSIVLSIMIMALITQVLYDSWLKDFIFAFFGKSIGMPGVIFELSFDGIIGLILIKILLGSLVLIIGLLVAGLGIFLGLIISPITYIIEIVKLIRGAKK